MEDLPVEVTWFHYFPEAHALHESSHFKGRPQMSFEKTRNWQESLNLNYFRSDIIDRILMAYVSLYQKEDQNTADFNLFLKKLPHFNQCV